MPESQPLNSKPYQYPARIRGAPALDRSPRKVGNGARKRPRQQELIKLARQRQLDVIIVWRLDRWGGSLVDLMERLCDLTSLGVGFVSITEPSI